MHWFFQDSLNNFEQKISEIQGDIEKNHKTIEEIKDAVRKLSNGDKKSVDRLKVSFQFQGFVLFHKQWSEVKDIALSLVLFSLMVLMQYPTDRQNKQFCRILVYESADSLLFYWCIKSRLAKGRPHSYFSGCGSGSICNFSGKFW